MFYSHLLLSKMGALGIVWMAAHSHHMLQKHQVHHTDISSSVDKILKDEVPVVTHRILAFLLLGVVRIYSKKVEYLFHDCYEVINKLHTFGIRTRERLSIAVSQTHYYSITLPKRFELDVFDLEQTECQDMCEKESTDEPLMREDSFQEDNDAHGSISKVLKANIPLSEPSSSASVTFMPPKSVLLPYHMGMDYRLSPSSNMSIPSISRTTFCLEDRLDPMSLDKAEEDQLYNKQSEEDPHMIFTGQSKEISDPFANPSICKSHSASSLEVLRGLNFSLENPLDTMLLDEAERQQTEGRPPDNCTKLNSPGQIQDMEVDPVARPSPQGTDLVAISGMLNESGYTLDQSPNFKMLSVAEKGQDLNDLSDSVHEGAQRTNSKETEPRILTEGIDESQLVTSKVMEFLETNTPDREKYHGLNKIPISVITPNSKLPDAVVSIPEVANVRTPATTESRKILKNRKMLFDQITVLSNKVLKTWIEEDPSDLKRERKKAPCTLLDAWKARKLCHSPQRFLDPFFSGMSMDLSQLVCEETCPATTKSKELSPSGHEVRPHDDAQMVHKQVPDVELFVAQKSPEQTPIAPRTPIATHLSPLKSQDIRPVVTYNILGHTTSSECIEKHPPSNEELELERLFPEEISSFGRDGLGKETRMTQTYLNKKFQDKNRRNGVEVLNMSKLLQGKTKKESARLFYEILVLKTMGCIDVEQANAYNDILLRQA